MTRVVVADDQELVRQGLRMILELAGIEVLAEAGDGRAAVIACAEHRPGCGPDGPPDADT